jgi:hypothetical protein
MTLPLGLIRKDGRVEDNVCVAKGEMMLAHILAVLVGSGSFVLYVVALFSPTVRRQNDSIWGGVGVFYALVLWFSSEKVTGFVLLGQTASVALLGWLGWQTLQMRRQLTQVELPESAPAPSLSPEEAAQAKLPPAQRLQEGEVYVRQKYRTSPEVTEAKSNAIAETQPIETKPTESVATPASPNPSGAVVTPSVSEESELQNPIDPVVTEDATAKLAEAKTSELESPPVSEVTAGVETIGTAIRPPELHASDPSPVSAPSNLPPESVTTPEATVSTSKVEDTPQPTSDVDSSQAKTENWPPNLHAESDDWPPKTTDE